MKGKENQETVTTGKTVLKNFKARPERVEQLNSIAAKLGIQPTSQDMFYRMLDALQATLEPKPQTEQATANDDSILKLQARIAALSEDLETALNKALELTDISNNKDEELKAKSEEIENLQEQLNAAQSNADDLNTELQNLKESVNEQTAAASEANEDLPYLTDACRYFECTPKELTNHILELEKKASRTTLIQSPIPENSILLSDCTPFEKFLAETIAKHSGCTVKEMLINRFLIVYQFRGNGDYQIRRFKSDRLKLAKEKFDNLETAQQQNQE